MFQSFSLVFTCAAYYTTMKKAKNGNFRPFLAAFWLPSLLLGPRTIWIFFRHCPICFSGFFISGPLMENRPFLPLFVHILSLFGYSWKKICDFFLLTNFVLFIQFNFGPYGTKFPKMKNLASFQTAIYPIF